MASLCSVPACGRGGPLRPVLRSFRRLPGTGRFAVRALRLSPACGGRLGWGQGADGLPSSMTKADEGFGWFLAEGRETGCFDWGSHPSPPPRAGEGAVRGSLCAFPACGGRLGWGRLFRKTTQQKRAWRPFFVDACGKIPQSLSFRWTAAPLAGDFSPANGLSLRMAQGYFGHSPVSQGCRGSLSCRTRRASSARVLLPRCV